MNRLTLSFANANGCLELDKVVFQYEGLDDELVSVRGKTAGVFGNFGTFQWTPGVRALCVLFLRACARLQNCVDLAPLISGDRGSIAASLDYALDKEPQWICEMFGLDHRGKSILRRLILRTNSGRKRSGPVCLGLNTSALDVKNIRVLVDDSLVSDRAALERFATTLLGEHEEGKESTAEVHELFVLRSVLEQAIVEELVPTVTDADLDELETILSEMDTLLEDSAAFLKLDIQFHRRLAELVGFSLASSFYRTASDKFHSVGTKAITRKHLVPEVQDEHRAILSAIRNRNAEAAKIAVQNHLTQTKERYERFSEEAKPLSFAV